MRNVFLMENVIYFVRGGMTNMCKKCGYSYWGYLGDVKFDKKGEVVSTPDGNAFYSWCIIRELQKRGYEVIQIMPDRDAKGFELLDDVLFSSWLMVERTKAYTGTKKISYENMDFTRYTKFYQKQKAVTMIKELIMSYIDENCADMEFILHEYRMLIPGRNDIESISNENWQPDYLIQQCLFEYCCKMHKKLILFDLDYKMDFGVYHNLKNNGCQVTVFDLGTKWIQYSELMLMSTDVSVKQVFIPFDFDNINYFDTHGKRTYNLTYIGNRYERDWCIDKYISGALSGCIIYGNWLEGGRDTRERWPNLCFGERIQTKDMRYLYCDSVSTILLAKEEYCKHDFMTARIIEAIFYGTVPLFIEEYGEETIKRYAGDYADFLTVRNSLDVCNKIETLRNMSKGAWINIIIEYMRDRLKFMDVKYFVNTIEEVI